MLKQSQRVSQKSVKPTPWEYPLSLFGVCIPLEEIIGKAKASEGETAKTTMYIRLPLLVFHMVIPKETEGLE